MVKLSSASLNGVVVRSVALGLALAAISGCRMGEGTPSAREKVTTPRAPTPLATASQSPGEEHAFSGTRENRLVVPREGRTERYDEVKRTRGRPNSRKRRRVSLLAPGHRGELRIVRGRSDTVGEGPLVRFVVEIEGRMSANAVAFARTVERVLADARGWGARRSFQRVDSEPFDLRVALVSPTLTDRLCSPLQTNGIFSCAVDTRAVLNLRRWRHGAEVYGNDVARYRIYMINHEVGHVLGLGHGACAASGAKAPVMMQQTKGVAPCLPNPWPLRSEQQ